MATVQAIDAKHVNPFIAGAVSAITALCNVETHRGAPRVKSREDAHFQDISAGIALTGQISGLVTINFTRPVICSLVTKMLDEPVSAIDQRVSDAVGEMAKTMAETAKQRMQEAGIDFMISPPVILASRFQSHRYPVGVPCIVVPIKIASGEFTIEVAVRAAK